MMLIRAAVPTDADEIYAVHVGAIREVCSAVYDATQIEAWTSRKRPEGYLEAIARNHFIVAVVDGRVVGFSELDGEKGVLSALYVHPDQVRQGVGSKLLEAVEAAARERAIARLRVQATLNAVVFYQAQGYVVEGEGACALGDGTRIPSANMHKELVVPPRTE
jgi:putative acetyltransferase